MPEKNDGSSNNDLLRRLKRTTPFGLPAGRLRDWQKKCQQRHGPHSSTAEKENEKIREGGKD
ncbi:TPA: hypothetical protein DIV45_03000 [Patescibacteria group bacterium]|nr:hypothetical protein [Patescibacteria group bacterium]